ncbi:hypothetical protein RN001_016311 [Aquatica leii]|uniref:Uncharacterized protein n=1 Tax=Aquatica leii TaxID=1421715 RepID=A0AAN7NXH4_9COLE|nr:hypothetical protein RN001_016311 [Aquatica leii]
MQVVEITPGRASKKIQQNKWKKMLKKEAERIPRQAGGYHRRKQQELRVEGGFAIARAYFSSTRLSGGGLRPHLVGGSVVLHLRIREFCACSHTKVSISFLNRCQNGGNRFDVGPIQQWGF